MMKVQDRCPSGIEKRGNSSSNISVGHGFEAQQVRAESGRRTHHLLQDLSEAAEFCVPYGDLHRKSWTSRLLRHDLV